MVVDRDGAAARAAAGQIGFGAEAYECDVTSSASVRQTVQAVVASAGQVDILVNSAGGAPLGAAAQLRGEDWDAPPAGNPPGPHPMWRGGGGGKVRGGGG